MIFSIQQILTTLEKLNIEHSNTPNQKNWLRIKCGNPKHLDKRMSNCSINIDSNIVRCYSCKYQKTFFEMVKENLNTEDEQLAKDFINKDSFIPTQISKSSKISIPKKKRILKNLKLENLVLTDFNSKNFYYTKIRGFNKSFLEEFNIKLCLSFPYIDHMIVPIVDKTKNIQTFEARKIMKFEYYQKYFKQQPYCENLSYTAYENLFKALTLKYKWRVEKGKVRDNQGNLFENILLSYLLLPKVLYPSNSRVQETLFNIDNLVYNENLILSEGIGTLPKLQQLTSNFSCIFGTTISEPQIEYLKKFKKRIILIDDFDNASLELIIKLVEEENFNNLYISKLKTNDEHPAFVREYKNTRLISADKYLKLFKSNLNS